MKIKPRNFRISVALFAVTLLAGCSDADGSSTDPELGGTPPLFPGDASAYTVGGVSFTLRYAPTSQIVSDDYLIAGEESRLPGILNSSAFWMAETEVTYELWKTVYDWATDDARGEARYTFKNAGTRGDGIGDTDQHPVTMISWHDALVWCNALTEYCDAENDTGFGCIYTDKGRILRNANEESVLEFLFLGDTTTKGFYIPSIGEWEVAARYQDGNDWTRGDHVSGDTSGYCYDVGFGGDASTVFCDYAWYKGNSGESTHPVGEKSPNALGIKDMSGNVWEWTYSTGWAGNFTERMLRGGSYGKAAEWLIIGGVKYYDPRNVAKTIGFRIVRPQ